MTAAAYEPVQTGLAGALLAHLDAQIASASRLLASILVMNLLGINSNIMSLGGIALAISGMVDSANVMVENAHGQPPTWRRPSRQQSRWLTCILRSQSTRMSL